MDRNSSFKLSIQIELKWKKSRHTKLTIFFTRWNLSWNFIWGILSFVRVRVKQISPTFCKRFFFNRRPTTHIINEILRLFVIIRGQRKFVFFSRLSRKLRNLYGISRHLVQNILNLGTGYIALNGKWQQNYARNFIKLKFTQCV